MLLLGPWIGAPTGGAGPAREGNEMSYLGNGWKVRSHPPRSQHNQRRRRRGTHTAVRCPPTVGMALRRAQTPTPLPVTHPLQMEEDSSTAATPKSSATPAHSKATRRLAAKSPSSERLGAQVRAARRPSASRAPRAASMVMGLSSRCTQLLGSRGRLAVTQDLRWVLRLSLDPPMKVGVRRVL